MLVGYLAWKLYNRMGKILPSHSREIELLRYILLYKEVRLFLSKISGIAGTKRLYFSRKVYNCIMVVLGYIPDLHRPPL